MEKEKFAYFSAESRVFVAGGEREEGGEKGRKRKSRPGVYMCIQWTANTFSYINVPQNSTMMSLWTCCELKSVNHHYSLSSLRSPNVPSPFYRTALPSSSTRSPPSSSWSLVSSSLAKRCSWQRVYSLTLPRSQYSANPPQTPSPPSFFFPVNPASEHIHKLLTAIWKVSGITRTVLIRTSWHILAETCTYGNSIRKREGTGGGERNRERGAHGG